MSSPGPPGLQKLYHLDRSSPDFHDQLSNVLYGEEYQKCVLDVNLHGEDLVWLVDYLDKVSHHIPPPHSLLKPVQALDCLNPSSTASRKCQRELRTICGARGILPTSYTLSSDHLSISPDPFAAGGYGDVHEGTLDGLKGCIKRVRVYQEGPQRATKVQYRSHLSPRSPSLTRFTDLLSRGRDVETLDTPKRRTPAGCHCHSLPARFGLDVWWGPTGLHQTPQCRSTGTRRFLPVVFVPCLLHC